MNTYLVVSETIYNIENTLKLLKKDIDNVITFNLDENSIDEVLQEASYFSMFDTQKCVIVKNAKFFGASKSSDSNKSKEDINKLLKYLDNENKSTKLIFTYNGKADSKKKIYNIFKDNNTLYSFPSLTKTDMKNELLKIAEKNNYKIDSQSLWYIINNSLNNLDLAINELKKIMLYYGKPSTIKFNDVVALTVKTLEENNFKLVDSIISKDLSQSLNYLNESKIFKVEPSIIISLLYREFKLMLSTILYEENGFTYNEILKNLKIQDWQEQKIKNNLRMYDKRKIKEEIVKLSDLDYKCKSGLINKDIVLITYIIDLCS